MALAKKGLKSSTSALLHSSVMGVGGGSLDMETNHTLCIEGLSKLTRTAFLEELFLGMAGFKEMRHIPEK